MSKEKPLPPGRLLGTGWEPHVDEIDGRLVYSIPVASGHMDYDFEFEIGASDLTVLVEQPYRRTVLFMLLHKLLQDSTLPGYPTVSLADFRCLADKILFGSDDAVADLIETMSTEHNMGLQLYIDEEMQRQRR
ncbi:MAG: hypothetical protein ACK4GG_10620 [Sphingomonas sp.]